MILGLSTLPVLAARVEDKPFEFGPGTPNKRSNFRTLLVPARSEVGAKVIFQSGSASQRVFIDLHAPSATSIGSTGPDGPVVATIGGASGVSPTGEHTFSLPDGIPTSEFGAPSTWRVRVRSALTSPTVKVSGVIRFTVEVPDRIEIRLKTPNFSVRNGLTSSEVQLVPLFEGSQFIDGAGEFLIRAKWHVDAGIGDFRKVKVELRRPNGTVAKSQTAFSQHAPKDKTPKLLIRYIASPEDGLLAGDWSLRVVNDSGARIKGFNIKKENADGVDQPLDPDFFIDDFTSTFEASDGTGTFDLDPKSQEADEDGAFTYDFGWTVPKPKNWHDLRWLQLRIREGRNVVLWIRFNEEKQTFSLFNEKTGRFEGSFEAGSDEVLKLAGASLHLKRAKVVASGPESPKVTLKLPIRIHPKNEARSLLVEVAAQDDDADPAVVPDYFSKAGSLEIPAAP